MKLKNKENFDVLVINNHWDLIDMIQSFMGDACLGTFFQKDISKIYFKGNCLVFRYTDSTQNDPTQT